jgi:hypothetical protein
MASVVLWRCADTGVVAEWHKDSAPSVRASCSGGPDIVRRYRTTDDAIRAAKRRARNLKKTKGVTQWEGD